ncbi:MAG: hypothetical protein JKX98_09270 [Alcanivoracaceae bacterium]|nr:hypothetical protein [Alcanivoracaceae bacterium]
MKVLKIILMVILVSVSGYFGVSNSFGEIGGPNQNACYHNSEFYQLATSPTSCPDPGDHEETVFDPHYTINDPECLIEIKPIL